MKLNREQIVTALECCGRIGEYPHNCGGCPMKNEDYCRAFLAQDALALIRELTESLDRVQKQCGEIIVECYERDFERLKQVAKLTEENKRLTGHLSQLKHRYDICKQNVTIAKADTLKDIQIRFAMHFGTYTGDAEVKVSEVFKLLSKFKEEMLEGEI